jgi:hypothetical protein
MRWLDDEIIWMLVCVLLLVAVAAVPFVKADDTVKVWEVAVICDLDASPGFRSPGVELGDIISYREANTLPWGTRQKEMFCFYLMRGTEAQMRELTQRYDRVVGEREAVDIDGKPLLDKDGKPVMDPIVEHFKERKYGLSVGVVDAKKALEVTTKDAAVEAPGIVDKVKLEATK